MLPDREHDARDTHRAEPDKRSDEAPLRDDELVVTGESAWWAGEGRVFVP